MAPFFSCTKRAFLIVGLLFFALQASAQQAKLDSLNQLLTTQLSDSVRIETLIELGIEHDFSLEKALPAFREAQLLATEIEAYDLIGFSHKMAGAVFYYRSDYNDCLHEWELSIEAYEKAGNKKEIANVHNNIGNIYLKLSQYPKAIDYYLKCLQASRELKNTKGIAAAYGNLGNIYEKLEEYDKALEYQFKSLEIDSTEADEEGMATNYINIGVIYQIKGELEKAIDYQNKALAISEKNNDRHSISAIHENIGNVLLVQEKYAEAIEYFNISLQIDKETGDKVGEGISHNSIGRARVKLGLYEVALESQKKALALAEQVGNLNLQISVNQDLAVLYEKTKNLQQALIHERNYAALKDSLFNQESARQVMRKELAFEYRVLTIADSVKRDAEKDQLKIKHDAELEQQKLFTNMSIFIGIAIFLFMLTVAIVYYRGYQNKRAANKVIAAAQRKIQEKNRELTSSIRYAQNIQKAIFPTPQLFQQCFEEHFVMLKPKDIVSGDFYWIERVGDKVLLAVVDCTGHGVPGAILSIIGNGGLRRAVRDKGLLDPAEILEQLKLELKETLRATVNDRTIRDGMDISLCCIDAKNHALTFAGANQSVCLIKNHEITVIRGDRMGIGRAARKQANFVTKCYTYEPGTFLYLYSDGFPDQFGGTKGKKLKIGPFKTILQNISKLPTHQQEQALVTHFEAWRGDWKQVDDVCVIGVKL